MKKTVIFLVCTILVLIITGCGDGNNVNQSKNLEEIGYQYLDVNKPILKAKGLVNYRVLSQKNPMQQDFNDMKVFKDLYDLTNVDVTWEMISGSAWIARQQLIMGDKSNWPHAIYHAYFSDQDMIKYSNRKYILPISDYLEYMPNLKALLDSRPDVKNMITLPDGKIYSLPRVEEMDLMPYPNLLFINKVWLKDLITAGDIDFLTEDQLKDGLSLTLVQMEEILTHFKNKDMNKNGKMNDEIPLSFVYNNWQGNQSDLFAAFGIPENIDHLIAVDDVVKYTAVDNKFKAAINFYADWVQKGLIDRSCFEISQDQFLASGKGTPKLGAFYWWESATVVSKPDDYICLNPLIGLNGEQMIGLANNPEISKTLCVIMATCPNPEVLLTYFDRFYMPYISAQIAYGPIGIVYEEELDENGKLIQKPIPEGMTADEFRLKHAPMGITLLDKNVWDNYLNMEPRAKLRLERLEVHAKPFVPSNIKALPHLTFNLAEINTLSTVKVNVCDYAYEKITSWLLNGGVSDTEWQTYKATINSLGLQDYLNIMQAAYNRSIA